MPHLDLRYLRENVSSDEEFIHQLLVVFIESTSEDLVPLKAAIETEDLEKIKRSAHKIKSSFRSLGMEQMTNLFQSLEDLARENHPMEEITPVYNEFILHFPEIEREIAAELAQGK